MVDKRDPLDSDDSLDLSWGNKVPENLKVTERARKYFREYNSYEDFVAGKTKSTKREKNCGTAMDSKKEDSSAKAGDDKVEDESIEAKDSKRTDTTETASESKEDYENRTQNVEDEIPTVTAEVVDDKDIPESKEKDDGIPKMNDSDYESPPFIYREGWGAVKPKSIRFQASPATILIFTDTKTDQCQTPDECATIVERLQQKHIRQGLDDIRYNFLLGGDGYIYEGRGFNTVPYLEPKHKKFEARSLVFAYIGNFPSHTVGVQMVKLGVRFMGLCYLQNRITPKIEIIMFDKEPTPLNLLGNLPLPK